MRRVQTEPDRNESLWIQILSQYSVGYYMDPTGFRTCLERLPIACAFHTVQLQVAEPLERI